MYTVIKTANEPTVDNTSVSKIKTMHNMERNMLQNSFCLNLSAGKYAQIIDGTFAMSNSSPTNKVLIKTLKEPLPGMKILSLNFLVLTL